MEQDMVNLKVGGRQFRVHKELLCYYSAYFHNTLKGSFKEAQENAIELNDVDDPTFSAFMNWLYSGCLKRVTRPEDVDDGRILGDPEYLSLYVFADRFDVRELRVEVMFAVQLSYTAYGQLPSLELAGEAFERLPETSLFCKYLTELIAHTWKPSDEDDEERTGKILERLPGKFIARIMLDQAKRLSAVDNNPPHRYEAAWCQFHEHTSEKESHTCKKRQTRHIKRTNDTKAEYQQRAGKKQRTV